MGGLEDMELNSFKIQREIEIYSDAYERALAENNIKILDDLFWAGSEVVRYGVTENLYGSDEIAAFRRTRKGGAPARKNTYRHITTINDNCAVVSIEFQQEYSHKKGRQMQTWIRINNKWKIIAAHVSLIT